MKQATLLSVVVVILISACSKSGSNSNNPAPSTNPQPSTLFTEYFIDGVKCAPTSIKRIDGRVFVLQGCGQQLNIIYSSNPQQSKIDTVRESGDFNSIRLLFTRNDTSYASINTLEIVKTSINPGTGVLLAEIPPVKLVTAGIATPTKDTIEFYGNLVYDLD